MVNIAAYATALAEKLMDVGHLRVSMVNDPKCRNFGATYGKGHLELNVRTLGYAWFDQGPTDEVNEILIHEFGHHYSGDHLSSEFHNALCRLGAKLARLALTRPSFFKKYQR
jgi:hypothetical protein